MSLPDRDAILAFVRESRTAVGKREIARAFGLKGAEREELKLLLREMEAEGQLAGGPGRALHEADSLPRVAVLTVISADRGRVLATPENWPGEGEPPRVRITGEGRHGHAAGRRLTYDPGDRLLVRITGDAPRFEGSVIKRLKRGVSLLTGVVERDGRGGLLLKPVDRRERRQWPIHHGSDVVPGELVRAELKGSGARTLAHVAARLGTPFSGALLSDIAIAAKGLPDHFPEAVEDEARRVQAAPLGPREDWTRIPFITIDPADARDHDDAVWAEPEGDGWRLLVAIADVSWFVRPGSALDRSAFDRGNSVYFPDRVLPMLPEELSNGACSLKAGADKAVLAASIHVGANGELSQWRFHRARVRIAANLAYEAVQAVMDGAAESELKVPVLAPLWDCWKALMRARGRRSPLDLELPEKRVILDDAGQVTGVRVRERLDAHRVIEEMMIAANVAAARALEEVKAPVMYRCHEQPDREKLVSLKEYLGTLGVSFALGQVITPESFNRVLDRCRDRADLTEISEAVLRAQTQAYYAPANTGHFGLNLGSYAHFTSPIRRYSDVCVHRSLVQALKLGEGGLPEGAGQRFAAIGEHISFTERRAMEAERETLDRYIARYLAASTGGIVHARISGVQAFGFFATVVEIGGDGLVPISALGDERFRFDEAGRYLEGTQSGTRYAQGQLLDLRLEEADPVTGALRFSIPGVEPVERRRFGANAKPRTDRMRPKHGGPPPGVRRKRG